MTKLISFAALPLLALLIELPHAGAADATLKAFSCDFSEGVFTVFEDGKPETEKSGAMSFVFASLDIENGSAQMVGNNGAADINLLQGSDSLHFLEVTPTGNLNVTSVYTTQAKGGRFISVHSRHVGISGEPWMSQFWGTCEAKY